MLWNRRCPISSRRVSGTVRWTSLRRFWRRIRRSSRLTSTLPRSSDRFNGTLAELHALAGMTGPDTGTEDAVVIVTNETPVIVDLKVGDQL